MSNYVKFRETISHTEYWNKELKCIESFPKGYVPPDIHTEGMVGQYTTSGKVAEPAPASMHVGEVVITTPEGTNVEEVAQAVKDKVTAYLQDDESDHIDTSIDEDEDLDLMDIDELRDYANEKGIAIPGNMKKAETIRAHIVAELNQ